MKYAPALILGAGLIYLIEYTDAVTAPINDPVGFLNDQTNGMDQMTQENNLQAFLLAIRRFESSTDESSYRRIVTGKDGKAKYFSSFADHPRIAVQLPSGLYSTAAGAYQFLAISKTPNGYTKMNTWDRLKAKLSLPDFSPASQDAAAIDLLKERGAYYDVLNGNFDSAIEKAGKEWQSIPGSSLAQKSLVSYNKWRDAFESFGGTVNV